MDDVDEFLAHYGIKGMRWGKRKANDDDPNPKSSKELVKEARANAKVAFKPTQGARIDRMFNQDKIEYDKLSDKDVIIKRGQELARITKRKDEQLRGMTYVSYTPEDRIRYKAVMSDVKGIRLAKRSYSDTYEVVYKATQTLKSPSEKARFDAFVDLMDAPAIPVGLGKKKKMITGREYLARTGHGNSVKKIEKQELGQKLYNDFVSEQFANTPINSAYFKSIRDKGYNALIDDNDRKILSDEPLMILDTKGAIKQMSVRKLTNDEINGALKTVTPPKNLITKS